MKYCVLLVVLLTGCVSVAESNAKCQHMLNVTRDSVAMIAIDSTQVCREYWKAAIEIDRKSKMGEKP